jgi:hypothetical protein
MMNWFFNKRNIQMFIPFNAILFTSFRHISRVVSLKFNAVLLLFLKFENNLYFITIFNNSINNDKEEYDP